MLKYVLYAQYTNKPNYVCYLKFVRQQEMEYQMPLITPPAHDAERHLLSKVVKKRETETKMNLSARDYGLERAAASLL